MTSEKVSEIREISLIRLAAAKWKARKWLK